MVSSRRSFVSLGAAGATAVLGRLLSPAASHAAPASRTAVRPLIKPPHLELGDTLALINPVIGELRPADVEAVTTSLEGLGMRVKNGARVEDCARNVPVSDVDRARELNALFEDRAVKAILPIRGGWGCARLLPHLDYDLIRRNPKVLLGFSDAAALLLGIHARTGLVTFHGPMGISSWGPFTVESMKRVLFRPEAVMIAHPAGPSPDPLESQPHTVTPGRARGRLLGGNLTVLSSMVGSPYLTDTNGAILFLEEVREPISEVDRMLTHLEQAGVLDRIRGLVFGQCTRCAAPASRTSLTLDEVLSDHLKPLRIPVWRGALIGHIDRQLTLPMGVEAEIDADRRTIQLLEPAVR